MVNLLIAGDFCPNDRVARLIEQEEYSDILGEIKPIIAQMDYSLINLECPIVECPIKPKEKQGKFSSCKFRHGSLDFKIG